MHIINDFIFDSNNLILYRKEIEKEIIDKVYKTFPCDNNLGVGLSELERHNPNQMHMKKIALNNVGICLTYKCNLRCIYCGYSSTDYDKNVLQLNDVKIFLKDIIRKRTIKKLITKKNEPLTILFSGGGEPTYEWDLFKNTILYIKKECENYNIPLNIRMTTNAVLNDEQIEFISNNVNHVMVSYDGLPIIQNHNRLSANNRETNSAVEYSIRELSKNGIPLVIRTTIWQSDFPHLKDMYEHIFSLVDKDSEVVWSIHPVMYEGRAVNHIEKQGEIVYEYENKSLLLYYIDLMEYIIQEKGKEKLKTVESLFDYSDSFDVYCGAYQLNQLWLLPDKNIVTCIDYKDKMVTVGKVKEENVEYFDKYTDVLLKTIKQKYIECCNCIAYRFCKGGCPAWHLRMEGTNIEPPECQMQKEYWKYIIESVLSNRFSFGWELEEIVWPDIKEKSIFRLIKRKRE